MERWKCMVCDYVYEEGKGDPDAEPAVAPGTKFNDLPGDWECPECEAKKAHFRKLEEGE